MREREREERLSEGGIERETSGQGGIDTDKKSHKFFFSKNKDFEQFVVLI